MSLINQDVRYKPFDPKDINNPHGFYKDILSLSPGNSSLTGTSPPLDSEGKEGDVFYGDDGQIYKKHSGVWETLYSIPGSASSGSEAINNIANVGTGIGIFKSKVDNNAFFKNLVASTNIQLNEVGDDIYISSNDTGAIINDAVISATEAWSSQKINNEITSLPEAKGVVAGSNKISVVEGVSDFTVDAVPANIDILTLSGAPSSAVVGVLDSQNVFNKKLLSIDGTVSAPAYSYASQPTTGMWYDPIGGANKFSSLGVELLSISSIGVNSVVQVRGQGNGTAPALSFSNKTNSGLQNQGNDVNLIANGQVVGEFKVGEIHAPTNVQFTSQGGSALAPDYALQQTNMGMFRNGNNELGLSVAGASKLLIDATNIKPQVPIETVAGTAGSPALFSSVDADTGIYFDASGLNISNSGAQKITIGGSSVSTSVPVSADIYQGQTVPVIRLTNTTGGFHGLSSFSSANMGLIAAGNAVIRFGASEAVLLGASNRIRPDIDGANLLGTSSRRWNTVYSANGVVTTSDARSKNTVKDLSLGLDFVNKLQPKTYKFNDTVSVDSYDKEHRIKHSRTHIGLVAQEVQKIIESEGLTLSDVDIVDNDYLVDKNENDRYSIRYQSLIPVLIKAVQELSAKVAILENK